MKLKVLASSSKGNCYTLTNSAGEVLIIEAGIKFKEILKGLSYDLTKVVGCICTHHHQDHAKALKELTINAIDVYASTGTFQALNINGYRAIAIEPEKQFKTGQYTILPFPVEHDAPGSLGFLIKCGDHKILFLTDTYYCRYNFKEVTTVLIEANCSNKILQENVKFIGVELVKRILKSHFTLENVIDFLKLNDQSKLQNIVLIHLSNNNSNAAEFKEEVEKALGKTVYVADKGMEIEL